MGIKRYLCALCVLLHVRGHVCPTGTWAMDCDNPGIPLTSDVRETYKFNNTLYQFLPQYVYMISNVATNRTEFIYVVADVSSAREPSMIMDACWVNDESLGAGPNDVVEYILPFTLGGPCHPANMMAMCANCSKTYWQDYAGQVFEGVGKYDLVLFCVKLVYPDAHSLRPDMIYSTAFSMREQHYIGSVNLNNPWSCNCSLEGVYTNEDTIEIIRSP